MSKKMCPALPKNLCPSQVAEAAIGIEKTCEGKQAALSKLMAVLNADVGRKRFTPEKAAAVVNARARGVEATCRLQKHRFNAAEIKRKAAEKALEDDRARIMGSQAMDGLGRARGPRRGSSSGLFGLGLFGL